ncbi:Neprosin, partial [Dillenia turbinata]
IMALDTKLGSLRDVLACVVDYKIDCQLSPEVLIKEILECERMKNLGTCTVTATVTTTVQEAASSMACVTSAPTTQTQEQQQQQQQASLCRSHTTCCCSTKVQNDVTWKVVSLGRFLYVILMIASMLSQAIANENADMQEAKGTIKTIKSEDGDVIDCVNIYKQPAFDHPLLENHTIQMKPCSYPSEMEPGDDLLELDQVWLKNGECPEGTIPIRRTPKTEDQKIAPPFNDSWSPLYDNTNHEYAMVTTNQGEYYGSQATINVWNPQTKQSEFSISQLWVVAGPSDNLNSVAFVDKHLPGELCFSDHNARFFTFWTVSYRYTTEFLKVPNNGYRRGCYNLDCPGFVQTNRRFYLGAPIKPVSTYNGKQYEISVFLYMGRSSGNWWLRLQNLDIGYFPSSLFTSLAGSASLLGWGGEIMNMGMRGHHTTTQMGGGHFASEGYGKASFFRNLQILDDCCKFKMPEALRPLVTKANCYDLHMGNRGTDYGQYFYYGGPGYSANCQ